ncbi:MAG: phosphoribosylformylglycinamidine synthase subunit PurQ [Candidatus Delongbacteria bacterium]|nr:phosphoribosylformylglycinamidine synthase subunit PurQ [Candidatus Delongbacteria bacterium]MDD4204592.1 phosphoribosylformylglycinamidine synthase subunit PurQ [Candidatus Delongbacteria bacterium]
MKPKVLTIITDGINCNVETGRAFSLAGAENEEVHLNLLLDKTISLLDYDILSFSGGFSYGDDVKSGKIFSLKLLKLADDIRKFIDSKKLIIGICNGFQVITTLGIVPYGTLGEPKVSLYWNDSAHFECRWVDLLIPENVRSPWLKGLGGKVIKVQAAHAEGRLVTKTAEEYSELFEKGLVAFQYADPSGRPTENYPFNPNGSPQGVAGLVDVTGQVIGMMPHPERNAELFHDPRFRELENDREPDGLKIFMNAVEYFKS